MKFGKKNLRYALIFLAIVVALYIFTQRQQLNVESFASSGISWWVWVLIVIGVIALLNVISFVMFFNSDEAKQHQEYMQAALERMQSIKRPNYATSGGKRSKRS